MSWVRLDDGFAGHRKVLARSDAAFRLEVAALCWCNQHANDGQLSAADVRLLSGYLADPGTAKAAVAELVEAGLWDPTGDGYELHDYAIYQPSSADVQARKDASAERMRKSRERRHPSPSQPEEGAAVAGRCADVALDVAAQQPGVTGAATSHPVAAPRPDPTRPDPVSPPDPAKEKRVAAPESSALVPSAAPVAALSRKPREPKEAAPTQDVWAAYEAAYLAHPTYGSGGPPVRNATVNRHLALLLKRIPKEDAPAVAEFFVAHPSADYAKRGHPVWMLLQDAESLHGQWRRRRAITATGARHAEQTASNPVLQVLDEQRRLWGRQP